MSAAPVKLVSSRICCNILYSYGWSWLCIREFYAWHCDAVSSNHKPFTFTEETWCWSGGMGLKGILKKWLSLCYSIVTIVYYYNDAQKYEQFLQVGRLCRALIVLGLVLSSEHLCVFSLRGAIYIFWKKIAYMLCLHPSLYLLVSWAWCDWPLMWLTNHHPSVLWHCCLLVGSSDP